jgi:Mn2+/Fe2+ NRAMP family transporter
MGIRITLFLVVVLVLCNFGNILGEFSGIAVSAGIFNVPLFFALPVAALSIWLLIVKGNYKKVEHVFLVGSAIYITYIASAILAGPNWGLAAKSLVVPHLSSNIAYIAMVVGVIGASISPWQMFYLQGAVVEKEVSLKNLKYSKLDAIGGALAESVIGFFIVLACAVTIFAHGIPVNNVVDISKALIPLAGNYAFGFLNASILSASIVPLATAYLVCEGLGVESGVNKSFREAPIFHGLYLGLISLACIIILIPNAPLLLILYFSQVINGMVIPFCLIFMLLIINDKKIMGKYVNSKLYNYVAGATVIVVIALTIFLLITYLLPH